MQEILVQIYSYLRGIWKRRWPMLMMAWFICLVGWAFVLKMPDQYRSSAKVYVDTQSLLQPLLRGIAIQSNVTQQVELMTKTLFSRPNLEKAARMTDLDLNVHNDQQMDMLLDSLADRVKLRGGGRQNIYTLSYEDNDPELAKKVVQSFLTIFVESSLGSSRKDSDVAQKFLDDQIKEYEARLNEAENRVKEFKQKNVGLMPGSGGDYFSMLKSAQGELKAAQDRLAEVSQRRDEIKRQLEGEKPTFGLAPSANVFSGGLSHPLDGRIAEMEKRRDDLLLKYTEKHPDVISLEQTIKRLKDKREKDLEEARKEMPEVADTPPLQQNPVYQQLKISLGQAEAEVASLQVRAKKAKDDVEHLKKLVDTVPAVEAEEQRLNRDYSIVKANYEQLLKRRESARVAQSAEATGDSVKFKVVEPPRVPSEPSGPNRPLLLSVVLLVAAGAGVGMAFFMSQIKQTFDTRHSLREITQLPVLGSISMDWSPAQRMKLRVETAVFFAVSSFLLLVFVIVLLKQEALVGLVGRLSGGV
jgi:polysaccharide chain length determinant protein (PEP-CTERM system associated)